MRILLLWGGILVFFFCCGNEEPLVQIIDDRLEYENLSIEIGASYCYGDLIFAGDLENGIIYCSKDTGITWEKRSTIQHGDGPVRGLFVSSKGILFASRDKSGQLMRSGDQGYSFRKCLELSSSKASTVWRMAENSLGWLFAAEYSNLSWDDNCAYIYRSKDDGKTWECIYNNPTHARHFHFVAVDPYTDYIYAARGDGNERAAFIRSTDGGDSWEILGNNNINPEIDWQFTSIAFTPHYRILGEDDPAQSDIVRTADDKYFEKVFEPDSLEQYNFWAWGRVDGSGNILFGSWTQHNYLKNIKLARGVICLSSDEGASWEKVVDFGLQKEHSGTHFASNVYHGAWLFCHSKSQSNGIRIRLR